MAREVRPSGKRGLAQQSQGSVGWVAERRGLGRPYDLHEFLHLGGEQRGILIRRAEYQTHLRDKAPEQREVMGLPAQFNHEPVDSFEKTCAMSSGDIGRDGNQIAERGEKPLEAVEVLRGELDLQRRSQSGGVCLFQILRSPELPLGLDVDLQPVHETDDVSDGLFSLSLSLSLSLRQIAIFHGGAGVLGWQSPRA
jgi:hypothetical protein